MKSFKWVVGGMSVILLGLVSTPAFATTQITWQYNGTLATPIPSVTSGWLVQMYNDVSKDTILSSITSFDSSGVPQGTSASDDVSLGASFRTTVNGTFWSTVVSGSISGDRIYTVLFNSSSLASATQAWIIDTTPTTATTPSTYTANATASTVGYGPLSVPEPSSLALIGVGLVAIVLRRRLEK